MANSSLNNNTFAAEFTTVKEQQNLFHNPKLDAAVFFPRMSSVSKNTRTFVSDINPTTAANFGSHTIFQLPKSAHFIEDIVLKVTLSPVTFGAPGTFGCYKNGVGDGMIRLMQLNQNSTLLWQKQFDQGVFEDLFLNDYPKSQAVTEAAYYLPQATRIANNVGPVTLFVPIRTVLDYFTVPLMALTSEPTLEFDFKTIGQVTQSDGTNVQASIISCVLEVHYVFCSQNIQAEILRAASTSGLAFPFIDYAQVETVAQAGTQRLNINLNPFRGNTQFFTCMVRTQADAYDSTSNPLLEFTNTQPYQDFNIQNDSYFVCSSPNNIVARYVQLHTLPFDCRCYFNPANVNTQFPMLHSWSLLPPMGQDLLLGSVQGFGGYNFSNTQTAELIINFAAPLAQACVISICGYWLNNYVLINGSLRRFYT